MPFPRDVARATKRKLKTKAETLGISFCCDSKDHMVTLIWARIHTIHFTILDLHVEMRPFKDKQWGPYTRYSIPLLKEEIYDRIGGIPGSHFALYHMAQIKKQDVLIAISLHLDTVGVNYCYGYKCRDEISHGPTNPLPVEKRDRAFVGLASLARDGKDQEPRHQYNFIPEPQALPAVIPGVPIAFWKFEELQPELRDMVWKLVMDEPRGIQFYQHRGLTKCNAPVPTLLHVCPESRRFALRTYKRYRLLNPNIADDTPVGPIYFDPNIDTVYFGPRAFEFNQNNIKTLQWFCDTYDRTLIKHVAYTNWKFSERQMGKIFEGLTNLPNLETFTWIPQDKEIWFQSYSTEFFDVRTHANTESNKNLSRRKKTATLKQLDYVRDSFMAAEQKRIAESFPEDAFDREELPEFRVATAKIRLDIRVQLNARAVENSGDAEDHQNDEDHEGDDNDNGNDGLDGLSELFGDFGKLEPEDLEELQALEDLDNSETP